MIQIRASVHEAAELFLARKNSATPVVDGEQKFVGIVSEGDFLMTRKDESRP